jgi:hypothetical protein
VADSDTATDMISFVPGARMCRLALMAREMVDKIYADRGTAGLQPFLSIW